MKEESLNETKETEKSESVKVDDLKAYLKVMSNVYELFSEDDDIQVNDSGENK